MTFASLFDDLWHLDPWCLCVTIFRARYSLLTILLPVGIALGALGSTRRGALYSLLLPRGYHGGEPDAARAIQDLFWIAFTSCCVVTLAGAGLTVATTHGPARSPSAAPPVAGCPATGGTAAFQAAPDAILVWSPGFFGVSLAAAAVLPLACVVIWLREQPKTAPHTRRAAGPLAVASVLAGGLTAGAVVLGIGVLRQLLFSAQGWILPLRPPASFISGFAVFQERPLGAFGVFVGRVLGGAGYLDASGHLLPEQAELVLILFVAGLVYGWFLLQTALTNRPQAWACTAVYLLVCIGAVGAILAGVAFWADRYGLSTPLLLVFVAVVVAWAAETDHFFSLSAPGSVPPLPPLAECFERRIARITPDDNGVRTAIVVTASGGGIQASAWTAEVLTGLVEDFPHFQTSLCLMSGVSGGSVGMGYFLAGAYPDTAPSDQPSPSTRLHTIRNWARRSLLEPVAWGFAFADLPRLFFGRIPRNRLVDRGWAIERLIDGRLSPEQPGHTAAEPARSRTIRDLCAAVRTGSMPVPLFNATCVQTGQRVIATPVSFTAAQAVPLAAQAVPPATRHGSRPLLMPEDYSAGTFAANPTLATAIRLSATFSYASPVARPTREDDARWQAARAALGPDAQPAAPVRFDLHVCDGGYADNSGVVSAVEACRHLLDAIRRDQTPTRCRILFIRIESFPESNPQPAKSPNGFVQMLVGPASSLLSARVTAQEERAKREIEAFGHDAANAGIDFRALTIRFGAGDDCPAEACDPAARKYPPLSWALSARQQQAIVDEWLYLRKTNDAVVAVIEGTDSSPASTPLAQAINWLSPAVQG